MAADPRRRAGGRSALAGAVLATALAGCASAASDAPVAAGITVHDEDGMHGAVLTAPYVLPDRVLIDTSGAGYDLRERTTAPLTLVFFGYTHCPDICHVVLADVASALARLDADLAERVDLLLVTTDPARDDPDTLRSYLDRFNPRFEGLTGSARDIAKVARGLRVPIERGPELPSGGYEVLHGTPVIGVLPDGTAPIVWTEGTSAARLAEDFHLILTSGIPAPTSEG